MVQHIGEVGPSFLDSVLRRASNLPVCYAADRCPFRPAHVYVAPPGSHLILQDGVMRLAHGPRHNRSRPAIDPLFQTAAASHGPSVIGVVLTGYLNDGSAGLAAIKQCGGKSIVQHPEDAVAPDMPLSALQNAAVDYCVPIREIPGILVHLVGEPAEPHATMPEGLEEDIELFRAMASNGSPAATQVAPDVLTCPECGGALRTIGGRGPTRYRCHTGHLFSGESLLLEQTESLERSLWAALRALKEKARLASGLALEARKTGAARVVLQYEEAAAHASAHAGEIERLLTGNGRAQLVEEPSGPVIS